VNGPIAYDICVAGNIAAAESTLAQNYLSSIKRPLIEFIKLAVTLAVFLNGGLPEPQTAHAEEKSDANAVGSTIRIGNTMPYSGPLGAYSAIGKTESAYFKMVNETGGINGRKIEFISYDDAASPPKTVEQVRKLVEGDEVLLLFSTFGTSSNGAIQKYLNAKGVPQLFVLSGATKWGDPKRFPWTMGLQPNYQSEGRIYAKYILEKYPNSKIGILYVNDDFGKDEIKALRDGLGSKADMIVSGISYENTDPTVDSQVVRLKNSGADIMITLAGPKTTSQAIRKVAELGWKPVHIIGTVATSVASVLKPAGLENAKGVISTSYLKDPADPSMKDDPAIKTFFAFMDKYYPEGDKTNSYSVSGYFGAQVMVQVLQQCGNDLGRENIMKQAANLKNFSPDILLPGIAINTGPDDFFPIEQMQMMQFDGNAWQVMGDVIASETGSLH
jgi:ABC-type branched-subunit amino acid transport system substrate-binding protein